MVRLNGEWKRKGRAAAFHEEPRYDHPYFQEAFKELNGLLAAELDGSPLVEYVDTFMYGFWGEGHTWPFENHPFPDYATAERTWVQHVRGSARALDENAARRRTRSPT